jgi:hypothetical protein
MTPTTEDVLAARERFQRAGISVKFTGELWEIGLLAGTVQKSTAEMISESLRVQPRRSHLRFDRFGAGRGMA